MAFGSTANLTFDILANDRASAKFDRLGRAAKGGVGPLSNLGGKLKTVAKYGALAAAAGVVFAAKFGLDAVDAASDLNEVVSKTKVVFGKGSDAMLDFADKADRGLGQSKQQALEALSTFGVLGKAAGLEGPKLTDFSGKLATLAADMASFSNTTPQEAIDALGSALRGEAEPIRKYGILLDDATLKAEALKLGLIDTTKQALTPQQKTLAAQSAIFKQAGDQMGDFERTSGGLANQQKILKAQFDNVKASIGEKLLPVAVQLVSWMNDSLIPGAQKAWQWMKDKLGPVFATVGEWIQTKLIPPLKDVGDAMGKQMPGFIDTMKQAFEDAKPALKIVGEVIENFVIPALVWLGKNVLPMVGRHIAMMGKAFGAVGKVFTFVWNNMMQPVLKFMIRGIARTLDIFGTMIGALSHVPGGMFDWAKEAADKLHHAADEARGFADSIKKIPNDKHITITTTYVSRQGPGGQGGGGGLGGNPGDPAGPAGKSGRTGGAAGRTSARSKSDLDGMVLRVVGLDPAMKAFLATGGTGRYS